MPGAGPGVTGHITKAQQPPASGLGTAPLAEAYVESRISKEEGPGRLDADDLVTDSSLAADDPGTELDGTLWTVTFSDERRCASEVRRINTR